MERDMNPEQWRPIPGWTYYAISSRGRVYSWKTRKYIKTEPISKFGTHSAVHLTEHVNDKDRSVAKLMLIAFGKTAPSNYDALIPLFLDGVPANIRLSNLSFKIARHRRIIDPASQQWHRGATCGLL
jgi:hypothetical protein